VLGRPLAPMRRGLMIGRETSRYLITCCAVAILLVVFDRRAWRRQLLRS
jgi:hypothetical protein